jgi:hypothetical protein
MRLEQAWLTPRDVADRCGYSVRWVTAQIEAGRLRAVAHRAGERPSYRIRSADFEAFRRAYLVATVDPDEG